QPAGGVPISIKEFLAHLHGTLTRMFSEQGFSLRECIRFTEFISKEWSELDMEAIALGLKNFYGNQLNPRDQVLFMDWMNKFLGDSNVSRRKQKPPESLREALLELLPEDFPENLKREAAQNTDHALYPELLKQLLGHPQLVDLAFWAMEDSDPKMRDAAARALKMLAPHLTAEQQTTTLNWIFGTNGQTGLEDANEEARDAAAQMLETLASHLAAEQQTKALNWILGTKGKTGLKDNDWQVNVVAFQTFAALAPHLTAEQQTKAWNWILGTDGKTGLKDDDGD